MWVFTRHGFFSVVAGDPAPDGMPLVMVRARVRADLERLAESEQLGPILEWPGRDYPYRVIVPRDTWARLMFEAASDIDYSNFKGMTARELGHARAGLYHDVWDVMFDAEKKLGPRARFCR
jgi:hypothetical protein